MLTYLRCSYSEVHLYYLDQLIHYYAFVISFPWESGYVFNVKGVNCLLYGAVAVALGDTPGINKFGGYKEGVAFAHRICRHCMAILQDLVNKVNMFYFQL